MDIINISRSTLIHELMSKYSVGTELVEKVINRISNVNGRLIVKKGEELYFPAILVEIISENLIEEIKFLHLNLGNWLSEKEMAKLFMKQLNKFLTVKI
jgi:hypothetical protein